MIRCRRNAGDGDDHGCEGDFGKEVCRAAERPSTGAIASAGSPWTSDGITPLTTSGGEHQVLASNAAVSSNFTNSSGAWISFVLTFAGGIVSQAQQFVPTMRQYLRAPAGPPDTTPPSAPTNLTGTPI